MGKFRKEQASMDFKLTYATMFDPPEEVHSHFDAALAKLRPALGKEFGMLINNQDVFADDKFSATSPVNSGWTLAVMQKGNEQHALRALEAARKAFPVWSRTPWQERVRLLRRVAALIEERLFDLSAAMALEVGKNRMESLGDVQETADLIKYTCDQMAANQGYVFEMGKDPLVGFTATNVSILRPYGVWLVISPFNFPFALTGGPCGAAIAAGNTVVIKPATDSAWIVRLLAECFRDAGLPDGVLNFVTGPGSTLGQALVTCSVDGVTFTGSFAVGAKIFRDFSSCNWVRPILLELGGKNAVIVTKNADLERASLGIIRSAFGLQGQKCSAASRILVEAPVYKELTARLKTLTENLSIGDPTERNIYLGPVINQNAYIDFQSYCKEIATGGGKFLTGGKTLRNGQFANGWYCQPTLVVDLPYQHRLWNHEMFLPIASIGIVHDLEDAIRHANEVDYGLTAGFFGNEEESRRFFDEIESGVAYANRPQGATTGAWPGFQPFGGWKASGSSGKNSGGRYYLPLYMHEQIQTTVK
jgi:1-pyrroline-5-carboxylate dehydrogenase